MYLNRIPSCTNLSADDDSEAHEILQCWKNTFSLFEIGNVLQLRRNTEAASKISIFSKQNFRTEKNIYKCLLGL